MSRKPHRDVFAYTPLLRAIIIVGLAICAAGFVSTYRADPGKRSAFVFYGFAGLVVMCCVALVQVFRGRIELRNEEIRVVELIGHRSYPRAEILAAKWEKGCPVSLKLRSGAWAHLPDTGHANTKVAGAVRAWLNEGGERGGDAAQQGDAADVAPGKAWERGKEMT